MNAHSTQKVTSEKRVDSIEVELDASDVRLLLNHFLHPNGMMAGKASISSVPNYARVTISDGKVFIKWKTEISFLKSGK